jgi:ribonuclease M5
MSVRCAISAKDGAMNKLKIDIPILVAGKYDKITLSGVLDANIFTTGGFSVFNDKEKLAFLRRLAEERGLIVLTDSDGAGFVIRNYLKGALPKDQVKQAYIPDIHGKERRKRHAGKEGKLGVEGMRPEIILEALRKAGATIEGEAAASHHQITKQDLMELGLSGGKDSGTKRLKLLKKLDLPQHMSANAMLQALNLLYSLDELNAIVETLENDHG